MDPDLPAMMPPDGQLPDFDNNGGHHAMGYAALIICITLAALSTSTRVWSRLLMTTRSFGLEEALLVCALGSFSGFIYLGYKITIFPGNFAHQWNIRLTDMNNFLWRVHICSIFYGLTLMLLKTAILVDWLRLFNPLRQRNALFWTIHVLIAANVIYYICAIFLEAFHCTPQRKIWDVFYEGGNCRVDIKLLNLAASVVNLISDIAILAVPQMIIWRLHRSRASRAGVAVLFLIGIGAAVCGLCRMVWLVKILRSDDATYYIPIMGSFGLGEITAGFLIIGIPSIPMLFRTLFSQDSAVRTFLNRTRLLSWTGTRRTAQKSESRSGGIERPWGSAAHKKPHGAWEISENDTFDLLSVTSAHVEADRYQAYDLNYSIPQNSIKRDMRVDVASERMG